MQRQQYCNCRAVSSRSGSTRKFQKATRANFFISENRRSSNAKKQTHCLRFPPPPPRPRPRPRRSPATCYMTTANNSIVVCILTKIGIGLSVGHVSTASEDDPGRAGTSTADEALGRTFLLREYVHTTNTASKTKERAT